VSFIDDYLGNVGYITWSTKEKS